jgi:5-methylcytosine-specific restriction protein A
MGKRISNHMIEACYDYASKVYNRQIELKKALDDIELGTGMGRGSAQAYVNVLCCMLDGKEYHRTINEAATDYFLSKIKVDYDREKLLSACNATRKHVDYYYKIRGGRLKGIERIVNKYCPV